MPTPTAMTSSGSVTSTPTGDASARPMRTALLGVPVTTCDLGLGTRLVHALRRELERGQKATLAACSIEPDARGACPQVRRIFRRVRRELVWQRACRRV